MFNFLVNFLIYVNYKTARKIKKDVNQVMDINGISISPKKNFSIVKIWLKNNSNISIQKLLDINIDFLNVNESIYSDHSLNIKKDKHKQLNQKQNYRKNYGNYKNNHRNNNRNKSSFYKKKKYNQFNDFHNNNHEW